MAAWQGSMPTACLNDRQIRPREYRRWRDAHDQFARNAKDRATVDELKASMKLKGLKEPLILGISERYPDDVYNGDGHHRAVALIDLGIPEFTFRWYWIGSFGRSDGAKAVSLRRSGPVRESSSLTATTSRGDMESPCTV